MKVIIRRHLKDKTIIKSGLRVRYDLLDNLGACSEGLEWFEEEFGDYVSLGRFVGSGELPI